MSMGTEWQRHRIVQVHLQFYILLHLYCTPTVNGEGDFQICELLVATFLLIMQVMYCHRKTFLLAVVWLKLSLEDPRIYK